MSTEGQFHAGILKALESNFQLISKYSKPAIAVLSKYFDYLVWEKATPVSVLILVIMEAFGIKYDIQKTIRMILADWKVAFDSVIDTKEVNFEIPEDGFMDELLHDDTSRIKAVKLEELNFAIPVNLLETPQLPSTPWITQITNPTNLFKPASLSSSSSMSPSSSTSQSQSNFSTQNIVGSNLPKIQIQSPNITNSQPHRNYTQSAQNCPSTGTSSLHVPTSISQQNDTIYDSLTLPKTKHHKHKRHHQKRKHHSQSTSTSSSSSSSSSASAESSSSEYSDSSSHSESDRGHKKKKHKRPNKHRHKHRKRRGSSSKKKASSPHRSRSYRAKKIVKEEVRQVFGEDPDLLLHPVDARKKAKLNASVTENHYALPLTGNLPPPSKKPRSAAVRAVNESFAAVIEDARLQQKLQLSAMTDVAEIGVMVRIKK